MAEPVARLVHFASSEPFVENGATVDEMMMQPTPDRRTLRVLETPRAMLVRVPLGSNASERFHVMSRGDTLLIAGDGIVEALRLPRPAAPRGLTARQDGDALYVRVPLAHELQPSCHGDGRRLTQIPSGSGQPKRSAAEPSVSPRPR